MKVKVIGNVDGKNKYGYVGNIPRGEYDVTIDGMVTLKGIINVWTLFLTVFQKAVQEKIIEIIEN